MFMQTDSRTGVFAWQIFLQGLRLFIFVSKRDGELIDDDVRRKNGMTGAKLDQLRFD